MTTLPAHARAVIVGGGVVGCSVAYHLAKLGWREVLLLERRQLTCGTTWHAAGLIGQLRATANMTRLARYSQELYFGLEAETGIATGIKRNGSISAALTEERWEELRRGASMARSYGVEIEPISPAEARRRHPLLDITGVVGCVFLPKDGQADPANIALALAKGARQQGATIVEGVKVTGVTTKNGRVTGVVTEQGAVEADVVVNCAGMWGREVGRMAGVALPLMACEHFYIVTEPVPGLSRELPVLRVPDECAYFKEDAGKILVGAFEPEAKPWGLDGIPESFCFDELPEDMEHFAPILETATRRLPALQTVGIRKFFNGPESFTHDNRYLLGEAPALRGFWVACGFNSVGIQSAGGAGKALAEWIVGGAAPFDLWDVDVRRTQPWQATRSFISTRVAETLGLLYADHFPYRQYASARGVRVTPLHDELKALGACFGEVLGWERASFYVPAAERARGVVPEYRYSWKRQNWFDWSAAEHMAVRKGVGLLDMSTFGKLRVEGPDAESVLQRLSANDVAVAPGRLVYTQWLNAKGCIEADLTVSRLSETAFMVITPTATVQRDLAWLRRHIPAEARAVATDVTSGEACLALMGPRSREVLQRLTTADLTNAAFPFGAVREIEVGMALVRAHRVSYVGELGFELFVASDFARHVFRALVEAGAGHGLRLVGAHAMDSLRLEKAYRHFGHDIGDEDHVLEAGLGFAVRTEKPRGRFGDFIGREAVLAKRQAGLGRRLVQFLLAPSDAHPASGALLAPSDAHPASGAKLAPTDAREPSGAVTAPGPLLYHTEPILRDGAVVGYLTSGAFGHHLGAAVGLGYVPCRPGAPDAEVLAGRFEIEVAGQRVPAVASLRPMYDPKGERLRA